MLIKILLSYIYGYIRVSIEGYYIERFINICANKKIIIWNLKRDKNIKLYFNVSINDFKEIVKIAKKIKCHTKIEKKCGLPFLLNRYKKRKIFAILVMVIIVLIIIISNFVWNIDIEQEDGKEISGIYQDVVDAGLNIGMWKSKIDIKDIINKVRLKREDIAWMGIELKGTNAIVKIVKADKKPEIVDDADYCSIVSDKVGVITKINAQNGTANVSVGDTVNVGTTLINGWLEGKYTGIRYVHAKADIEAKIWYSKKEKVFLKQQIQVPTGATEEKYTLNINNFKINFYKTLSKFENYDTINENKKLKLLSNFYLPIEIIKKTNYEYKYEEKIYTEEELAKLTEEKIEKDLDEKVSQKENIINKQTNIYPNEDYIEVEVIYEVLENIGTEEKIAL